MADDAITPEQGDLIHDALTALSSGQPFTLDPKKAPPTVVKAIMALHGKPSTLDSFKDIFTGSQRKIPGWGEYSASDIYGNLKREKEMYDDPNSLHLSDPAVAAAKFKGAKPAALTPDQVNDLRSRFKAADAYSYARDPAAKLNLMKIFDPETASQAAEDPWGNPYVIKGGKKLYLNEPGASMEDIKELGSQTVATAPLMAVPEAATAGKAMSVASKVAAPAIKGLLRKVMEGAVIQGAGSANADQIAEQAGSGQGISVKDTIANALAGGAGETIAPIISKIGGALFNYVKGTKYFTPAGVMKPQGMELMRKAGLDWGSLSGDVQSRIKAMADKSTDPQNLAQLLASQDLPGGPIRLTRAQSSGDIGHYADEDLLRSGAFGDSASGKMKDFDFAQADDIRKNAGAIADQLNPGKERQTSWNQGGSGVTEELQNQKKTFANVLDDSFDAARDKGKTAYYPSLDPIKSDIMNDHELSPILNPGLETNPAYKAAFEDFKNTFGSTSGNPEKNDPSVSVEAAFNYLKRINALIRDNPMQSSSLTKLKQRIQRGLADDAMANTVKGDPEAVNQFLKSNKMYRDFANVYKADDIVQTLTEQKFDPMNPGVKAFKVDPSDGSKIILGTSRLGFINKTEMKETLNKLKSQLPTEQWNNLREEVFLRALGWSDKDMFGQGQLVQSGAQFKRAMQDFQQKSPEIYNTLFSDQEKATLQRFNEAYQKATLAPPTKSTMGSRTTPLAMRAAGTALSSISPKLKFMFDLAAKPIQGKSGVERALGPSLGGGMELPPQIQLPQFPAKMLSLPGAKAPSAIVDKYYGDDPALAQ